MPVWSTIFDATTGVDLTDILSQITTLVPIVLPAVIGFLAFRKGWSFIKTAIKGA